MTLGALGGAVKPLTWDELLQLPPVVTLPVLGRALGVSEPVIRERARRGELDVLGIRCLKLGAQWRVPTEDILRFLGITRASSGAPGHDDGRDPNPGRVISEHPAPTGSSA